MKDLLKKVKDSSASSQAAERLLNILYGKEKVQDGKGSYEFIEGPLGTYKVTGQDATGYVVENKDGDPGHIDFDNVTFKSPGIGTTPTPVYDSIEFKSKVAFMKKVADATISLRGSLKGKRVKIDVERIGDSMKIRGVYDEHTIFVGQGKGQATAACLWEALKSAIS